LTVLACAGAQEEKAVFKIYPLETEGASTEDARLLETVMFSYFSDQKDVSILPPDSPDAEPELSPVPDYFVKSSLRPDENGYIFEIVINDASSHELSRQTAKYRSTKDIALNMHTIVNAVFEWQDGVQETPEAPDVCLIDNENILGLWNGDMGIKLVRILPNGKAFAFFTSGVNMMLSYEIRNNTLVIRQVSPNNENFYYPLPLPITKILAKEAEPMRWEFMLYENENLLKGERIETTAESEDYEKTVIRHNTVRKSEWNRMTR
ncbi:MAG: hypothetical protein LBJ86_04795, partial [Spirochaetaceae bacterium]|nr:hypothetical protein [Spirochaetaceae bacterium]